MSKCYTFIENYKDGLDLFIIWQRIKLDEEEYKELKDFVVLTSEYKWQPPKPKKEWGCGCW